jgi:hypothetical protein
MDHAADTTRDHPNKKHQQQQEEEEAIDYWKIRFRQHRRTIGRVIGNVRRIMLNRRQRAREHVHFAVSDETDDVGGRRIKIKRQATVYSKGETTDSSMELSPTGNIQEVPPEYFVDAPTEPFIGMVLKVFNVIECTDNDVDCQTETDLDESKSAFYELVEPLHLKLGVRPQHHVDYVSPI